MGSFFVSKNTEEGEKIMKKLRGLLSVIALLFVCHIPMQVQAETFYNSPYISFSPDGEAWTVAEELPYTEQSYIYWETGIMPEYWYPSGTTRETGIASSIRALRVGEHYYKYTRMDEAPVGRWEVMHTPGACIHGTTMLSYHGVPNVLEICGNAYYSGWFAYCADCGEQLTPALVYMSKDAMNTIDSIDLSKKYYYVCPTNGHIDNSSTKAGHECKAISPNQYRVVYDVNFDGGDFSGYMSPSFHMYNNATEYEGNPVTPITKLSVNSYVRMGYTLAGWNTEPDGSGTFYEPEATIFNLSSYDYYKDNVRGTVTLYAQWVTTESTLQINPNGGSYDGNSGISSFTQGYGTNYHADPSKVVAPKGATVTFQPNGGTAVAPITGTRYFEKWQKSYPFYGRMKEDTHYYFIGKMGEVDTLTAQYGWNSITLPGCTKPNYSFGGWYADAGCTQFIGTKGDTVTLYQDTVLYAKWVTLVLTSKDNYVALNRSGAVDLKWHQNDSVSKIYKVMQLKDGEAVWKQIYTENVIGNQTQATKTFGYTGGVQTYTVAYNGYYTISATGGKGGNYGSYVGGKGGYISGQYWLKKGDIVRVYVGGQGSGITGGKNGSGAYQGANSYANGSGGGAATVVTITRNGSTSTLLIAGGGGGANIGFSGGAGGTGGSYTSIGGASGVGGGGGGYQGGTSGNYQEAIPAVIMTQITGSTIYMKTVREYVAWQGDYAYWPMPELYETIDGVKYRVVQTTDGETLYSTIRGNIVPDGVATIGNSSSLTLKWSSRCEGDCGGGTGYHMTWGEFCNGVIQFYRKTAGAGTPEKKNASQGGTNYYSTGFSAKNVSSQAGTNNGNGAVVIAVTNLGFQDTNYLNGVKATDFAAPNAIDEIECYAQGTQDYVTVEWEKPKDNGTGYKHMLYSYPMSNTNTYIASNITYNILTTQVKGYYCLVDTATSTPVTKSNLGTYIADNNGGTVNVKMDGQTVKYLHIAAMDWAGNLGATSHLKLDPNGIAWDLSTEQIKITDVIVTKDYGTVYTKGDGKYYVRADGKGPFQLSYESKMNGSARDNYQIDYQIFDSTTSAGVNQRYITKLPYTNPLTSTSMLPVSDFVRKVEGGEVLTDAMNTGAMRTNTAACNYFYQSFTMPKSLHGQTIVVTPVVGATYGKDVKYSTWADDVLHSITLIADGEAPIVTGDEVLQGLTEINRDEQDIYLDLMATDDLSGVRNFKVHIYNKDSTESAEYAPDADGHIRIHLTGDETIFYGDLSIIIEATDNVGNTRTLQYGALEFALQAKIERILPPHAPVFQRGESGILSITTWGYADRVEVEFPQELLEGNLDLVASYDYAEHSMYMHKEEIQFMIPLDMPWGNDYRIIVRAYKDGTQLEMYPDMSVLEVEGTTLDEFRTRLR